jgi:competence protein ComEA
MSSPAVPPEDRARWPWISLTPLGFGCWAPIYGGLKARAPLWVLAGVLWTLILLTGFVLNGTSAHPGSDDLAGACFIVAWIGGAATSFGLRGPYQRRTGSPLQAAAEAGEAALRDEAYARELVRRDPRLAQHMGIGRPDRPGAAAAGLVDMNNADANALSTLPGIDDALAARILATRAQVRGFSSLEDLGTVMDLDGALVEGLRERAIFLPRA